jgi:MOSC domain-containing protein YiiM
MAGPATPLPFTGARVVAVQASSSHKLGKDRQLAISLITAFGVEGDAHAGERVQHLFDKRKDPTKPNLRQVHLMPQELFTELAERGFEIYPGQMGENITTQGLDLITLPRGTLLTIGDAVIEVTGLRSPCSQLERLGEGLANALLARDAEGRKIRKCGVMGIVATGGMIMAGDEIKVLLPAEPHLALEPV